MNNPDVTDSSDGITVSTPESGSSATCEHLAGEWQGADEGGVFLDTEHDRKLYGKYAEEWFKFCPRCGKPMPPNDKV